MSTCYLSQVIVLVLILWVWVKSDFYFLGCFNLWIFRAVNRWKYSLSQERYREKIQIFLVTLYNRLYNPRAHPDIHHVMSWNFWYNFRVWAKDGIIYLHCIGLEPKISDRQIIPKPSGWTDTTFVFWVNLPKLSLLWWSNKLFLYFLSTLQLCGFSQA